MAWKKWIKRILLIGVLAVFMAFTGNVSAQGDSGARVVTWLNLLLGADGGSGLYERPSNGTCLAPARASAGEIVRTVVAFPQLSSFDRPTKMLHAPGDDSRWYVLEKGGRIKIFDNSSKPPKY